MSAPRVHCAHELDSYRVMPGEDPSNSPETLGRIALKQVRVSRAEVEARNQASRESSGATRKSNNPMNRLVPYLDLFCRLSDEELSRLARTPTSAVEQLRQQIDDINRALGRWADLLPRLSDEELVRLTGATIKTIRFWRLSQPRHLQGDPQRRSNPDVTPTPQPIPRREGSSYSRSNEDSESSSSSSSSSSGSRRRSSDSGPGHSRVDPEPEDSATFVIDTIE